MIAFTAAAVDGYLRIAQSAIRALGQGRAQGKVPTDLLEATI